jgi:hypothetical protein
MDSDWLFSTKYDELIELLGSSDDRDFLRLAIWLRSFLLEGELSGEAANRSYGLTIRFSVALPLRPQAGKPCPTFSRLPCFDIQGLSSVWLTF